MPKYLLALILLSVHLAAPAQSPRWKRTVLNEKSNFEAAGVADFNDDGMPDIMSGDTYYAAPDWKPVRVRDIKEIDGYRLDFANVPMDVNGDGWMDVVSCNWHDQSVTWRENPRDPNKEWPEHLIDKPGNMETAVPADIDADGRIDFLPDVAQKTVWYSLENGKFTAHVVSPNIGGHGIGFGDVNGDGRSDILKPGGWFEAPEDRRAGPWIWHPEWNLGAAGIEIIAHDFTGDGLPDIFTGMGHDYGMFWLEQTKDPDPAKKWIRHEIDKDWSQAHAMMLVDLDGNGVKEVLTGKRKYAHTTDPGAEDKMVIFIYSFNPATKTFTREVVHEGDGLGLAPAVADIDGDGDLDIVAPGKSGLYLYQQETGRGPTPPEKARSEMRVPDGFEITLFASEPDIRKPIAFDFDARGRMIIAEAASYPLGPREGEPATDSIKILEDTDRDGRADKITVFADGLNIPDAVAVAHNGLIVAEAPNLWLMRDTDGDDRADEKTVILTGFGRQDTHHMIHGLAWGPEGKLLMTQGCFNSSDVLADGKEWHLDRGNFFRCWPDGSALELIHSSFTNSWGFDWDDYGNWIGQDNEGPRLIHLVDRADYGLNIMDRRDGQPGILPGIPTDGARSHGYVIQSGLVVYSGDAFPREYNGDVFEGAPGLHKIIRDTLEPSGASFFASEQDDLLATDDPWHRPIALTVGPDGAIYMLDWYNEILAHVEHPLDSPRRDRSRGRIYRIAWKGAPKTPYPDLTKASPEELRDNLRSDNRWLRRMSQRLLAARGHAAVDLVLPLLGKNESPRTRCHALWTIVESRVPLNSKIKKAIFRGFDDPDSRVRAAAIRSSRHLNLNDANYAERLTELTRDPDDFAKFEAALSLASLNQPLPMRDLAALIGQAHWEDPFLAFAFAQAIGPQREEVVMTAFELGARSLAKNDNGLLAALLQLRDPRTVPLLLATLRQPKLKPASAEELVSGLNAFDSPDIFPALVRFLSERPSLSPRLASPILSDLRARKQESTLATSDIERVLVNLADRGSADLRRDVFLTAAKLQTRSLSPQINSSLDVADPRTAEAAILATGELALTDSESDLLSIAASQNPRARWAAVRALSQIAESDAAAEVFLAALASPDSSRDALTGLQRLSKSSTAASASLEKVVNLAAFGNFLLQEDSRRQLESWIREQAPDRAPALLSRLSAADGVLRDWKVIGPFPNPDTKGHATVYPPETELNADAEYNFLNQTIRWQPTRPNHPDGLVDLMTLVPNEAVVAYAWTTLASETDRAATLYAGSDDSIKIWINGELVHDHLVDRGLIVDQDSARVSLRKGENTILVKIGQNRGGWNFHVRIAPAIGANTENEKELALWMKGNPDHGRDVFFQSPAGCVKCHAIAGEGGRVGPDLTELGWLNPRSYILNSILNPSDDIAGGFAGLALETKDNGSLEGYIHRESSSEIEFVTSEGKTLKIRKRDIARRTARNASGMPDALEDALTTQELADLLAFLEQTR
jgi:putative membrane-bound dehydrogenase-like protein